MARKAKLRTIEIVLHWAWDPIGVRGIEQAKEEYDSYALPVFGMLEIGAADHEIAEYLTKVEREWMGLEPNPAKNADIAAMLRELHKRGDFVSEEITCAGYPLSGDQLG